MSLNHHEVIVKHVARDLKDRHTERVFNPDVPIVPVAGKVFGREDLTTAVQSDVDFCLTSGIYTKQFERRIAKNLRMNLAFMTNSKLWVLGQSI